jgi:hypothetical protein
MKNDKKVHSPGSAQVDALSRYVESPALRYMSHTHRLKTHRSSSFNVNSIVDPLLKLAYCAHL